MTTGPSLPPREPYALTERELAERWRVSPRTLERWRTLRKGPAWLMIGGRVIYLISDVLDYERARRRGG